MIRCSWRVALVATVAGLVAAGTGAAHAEEAHAEEADGVQVVESTSPRSRMDKGVTTLCPEGTKLYSAGARVDGLTGEVAIDAIEPLADLSGVVVRGKALKPTAEWSVTGFAVCAPGDPVLVRRPAMRTALVVFKDDKDACGDVGSLTGVNGKVVNGGTGTALFGLIPDAGLTTATAKASGPEGPWSVESSAICDVKLVGRLKLETAVVKWGGGEQSVTASCQDGYDLIGTGGTALDNAPDTNASLQSVEPDNVADSVTVVGTKGASPWSLAAYAICLKEA
jgi:hypothetical protein